MARKPMRRPCTFMGRGTRRLLGAGAADTGRADSMASLALGADEMGGGEGEGEGEEGERPAGRLAGKMPDRPRGRRARPEQGRTDRTRGGEWQRKRGDAAGARPRHRKPEQPQAEEGRQDARNGLEFRGS